MRCAAHRDGLQVQSKPNRGIASSLLEDLAMQEAQISRAVRFLHRRQMEGACLEPEWRALTSSTKIIEETLAESRAALAMAKDLPLLSRIGEDPIRIRAVAERYLQSANFMFDRAELTAFLAALQEEVELG